jgi:cell division protein FtsL
MSFGNYLQEVKCLSRRQRVLNLANQLDAQFNGNKENIVEFLGS